MRGSVEHAVVELSGELDFTCAGEMADAILSLPHHIASIEASMLDFIDSAGVSALLSLVETLHERSGHRPAVVGMNPVIERTMTLVEQHSRELAHT